MLQLLKYCMFLESRLTKPGNIFPIFNCPVLVSMGKLLPHFPVLSWQGCHQVQYTAAVAHFAQDSRFSVHSEIFLLTWFWQVVVWVLLLSYQVETVWHSPLTLISKLPLTGCFSLFPKGGNPRDGAGKSQHINSFWNTLTSPSGSNNNGKKKWLFFSIQMLSFNFGRLPKCSESLMAG